MKNGGKIVRIVIYHKWPPHPRIEYGAGSALSLGFVGEERVGGQRHIKKGG